MRAHGRPGSAGASGRERHAAANNSGANNSTESSHPPGLAPCMLGDMPNKRRLPVVALLLMASVLPAGCGRASSSPNKQRATSSGRQQAALARLAKLHGRAYVEASNNLPDQIETR